MSAPPPGAAAAASSTHRPRWRAQLFDEAGQMVTAALPIRYGTVVKDEQGTRINCDIPTQAVPQLLDQSYLPAGGSIAVDWRFEGVTDWQRLARCDIVSSAIARPEGNWVIACADRGRRIALDDLGEEWLPTDTATYATVITELIRRTFPAAVVEATGQATTMPFPAKTDGASGDPWRTARSLAATAGARVYEDAARSVFVIQDVPAIGTPVDTLAVGEGGCLTRYTIQHELGYNRCTIEYVNDQTGKPLVTGEAIDNRATSPVAVDRIGTYVTYHATIEVAQGNEPAQGDADQAALQLLRIGNARMRRANLVHAQRPWLEPGDTITATYLGGPTENLLIDQVEVPLTTGEEQITMARTHDYQLGGTP
jgi:hypothetical protein